MAEHKISLFEEKKLLKISKNEEYCEIEALLKEKPDHSCQLTMALPSEIIVVEAGDFFDCLCEVKKKYPDIMIYCKGYKKNVYPSRMTRQMGLAMKAYEMELGKQATFDNLVWIFDFEDKKLTTSNEEQETFYKKWLSFL